MKVIYQSIITGLYKAVLFEHRKPKLFRYFKVNLNGIHIYCYDLTEGILSETIERREYHKKKVLKSNNSHQSYADMEFDHWISGGLD